MNVSNKNYLQDATEIPLFLTDLLKCQQTRLKTLKVQCAKSGLPLNLHDLNKEDLKIIVTRFLVDNKSNVTLRSIPKSGCSSWKSMFLLNYLNDTSLKVSDLDVHNWGKIRNKYGLKVMHELSENEIRNYLDHTYSILTVRHPLARLESGFRDKILKKSYTIDINNQNVVAAEFQRFLDAIINTRDQHHMNIHWKPVTIHTNPCAIPFE